MKALLLAVLVIAPGSLLACANKIDPNKVMLFVDTNNSELEIATTQKAACARGERLVVVPRNYKEFGKYTQAVEAANKQISRLCNGKNPNACKEAQEKQRKAFNDLMTFKSTQPQIKDGVREAMEELKKANSKLVNVSLSGHDGGGSFGGNKGGLSRDELAEIMKDYDDLNEVKSLLLLGCYTGTQHEVINWKSIFPDTRLIAGYDGSAPLADRPQGHQYITDILNKEKQLVTQADAKKLQAYLNANLKGLNQLSAAMYFQCSDGSSLHEYYYGSKKSRKVSNFDTKECLEKKSELEEMAKLVQKYTSGELEPPTNTQSGELRVLYNRARADEHCIELTGIFLDTNAIFNLLFNEGVEQSFAHYYEDDLKEVEKYLNFDPEEMEKNFKENLAELEEKAKNEEALAELAKTAPESYFAQQEADLAENLAKIKEKLKDPNYAAIKDMVNLETGEINWRAELNEENYRKLNAIATELNNHNYKKSVLQAEKQNPEFAVAIRQSNATMIKQNISNAQLAFAEHKKDLTDPAKKIWIPNAENLKKRSRKELMDNMHRLNGLLAMNVLKPEQTKAAMWLNQSTANHLQYFNNPFSWHEFTGHVEKPDFPTPLKSFMEMDLSQGGGMGGGMGGYGGGWGAPSFSSGSGSISGGGMVGGSSSGGF